MTHLTIDELLAVRDGESTQECEQHLASCPSCQGELGGLQELKTRLSELPPQGPDRDVWPAICESAEMRRWRRVAVRTARVVAGLAAVFTLAVGVRGGMEAWKEAKFNRETRALMAESQRLERYLRDAGSSGRVIGGQTASTIAEIEEHIAQIDAQLAQAQAGRTTSRDVLDLWQERVRLLDAVANVQTTRVAFVGL